MTSTLGPIAGTPYIGGNQPGDLAVDSAGLQQVLKSKLDGVIDPQASDNFAAGYAIGSRWTNTANGSIWECYGDGTWSRTNSLTSPGGSGTELQYRSGGSFGAVSGSSVSGSTVTLGKLGIGTSSLGTDLFQAYVNANQLVGVDQFGTLKTVIPTGSAGWLGFGAIGSADSSARFGFGLDTGKPWIGFGPGTSARDAFIWRSGTSQLQLGSVLGTGKNLIDAATGQMGVNKSSSLGAQLHVVSKDATTVGQIVEGAASSSVDLAQWNPNGVTAGTRARVTSAGAFSCTYGLSQTEVFGANPTFTSALNGAGIGDAIKILGAGTALGSTAVANDRCVAVGFASQAGIQNSLTSNSYNVAIGYASSSGNASASHFRNLCVGGFTTAQSGSDSKCIGHGSTATGNSQFVSGSGSSPTDTVHFGKGVTSTAPTAYTITGTTSSADAAPGAVNITGGAAWASAVTNLNGADVRIFGGTKVGAGSDGNVYLAHDGTSQKGVVLLPSGAWNTPSVSFAGDTDTGINNNTANRMDFVCGGTTGWTMTSSFLSSATGGGAQIGRTTAVNAPTYAFSGDGDTGFHTPGANRIMAIVGATALQEWDAATGITKQFVPGSTADYVQVACTDFGSPGKTVVTFTNRTNQAAGQDLFQFKVSNYGATGGYNVLTAYNASNTRVFAVNEVGSITMPSGATFKTDALTGATNTTLALTSAMGGTASATAYALHLSGGGAAHGALAKFTDGGTDVFNLAGTEATGGFTQAKLTVAQPTNIGLMIKLPSTPTANVIEVNSVAGGGGDVFKLTNSGNIIMGNGAGSFILSASGVLSANGRSTLWSPSNGIWAIATNNGLDFNRLVFGGTATSSFPSLKRSSAALHCRLGDDSNYADFSCQALTTFGTFLATSQIQGDLDNTAGNTRLIVYDVDTGGMQRVRVGANGTGPGGSGRALYLDAA